MTDLKVVALDSGKTYVAKNGKEYPSVSYYVVVGSTWVAIRPSFKEGYYQLSKIAERRVKSVGKQSEKNTQTK